MKMRAGLVFVLNAFCSLCLFSQEAEPGNWLMYFGQNRVAEKWSVHSEVQYRNHTAAPGNIEQLLLRTGMNYHLDQNAMLTIGYGNISSHLYQSEQKDAETTEHRVWQQLILKNSLGKLNFEHRYRVEQRWVNEDYSNRLRYRMMVTLPLKGESIESGDFYIGLYDEIFVNTEKNYFDRNRLYGALGYLVNEKVNVQTGMLYQTIDSYSKWYMQFALIFNTDLRKKGINQ